MGSNCPPCTRGTTQGCSCRHPGALILLSLEWRRTTQVIHRLAPDCRSPEVPLSQQHYRQLQQSQEVPLPAQTERKNMERLSRGFKCMRADIFSVLYFLQRVSHKQRKLPKVSSSQLFLPSLFHPTSLHRTTLIMMEDFELKVSST